MDENESDAVGVPCSDAVIARLIAFCDNQDVARRHQRFCRAHVAAFHGFRASEDDEKAHTIHELFTTYESLFEQIVQDFLDMENMTPDAFYDHCRRLHNKRKQQQQEGKKSDDDDDDDDNALLNLRILLSALDFTHFCELMEREAVDTQRALKQAEDMGL